MTKENLRIPSDDPDTRPAELEVLLGGNGDYYITVIEDRDGVKTANTCRISTSGGNAPSIVKIAVAELYRSINCPENSITSSLQKALEERDKEVKELKELIESLAGALEDLKDDKFSNREAIPRNEKIDKALALYNNYKNKENGHKPA